MIIDLLITLMVGLLALVQVALTGIGSLFDTTHVSDAFGWAMQFDGILPVSDALGFLSAATALIGGFLTFKLILWAIQVIRG